MKLEISVSLSKLSKMMIWTGWLMPTLRTLEMKTANLSMTLTMMTMMGSKMSIWSQSMMQNKNIQMMTWSKLMDMIGHL